MCTEQHGLQDSATYPTLNMCLPFTEHPSGLEPSTSRSESYESGAFNRSAIRHVSQPHLKTSLAISMLQVCRSQQTHITHCIKRNKVPKELHYHFIIQISLEPNLTYKIRTPTSYISNYYQVPQKEWKLLVSLGTPAMRTTSLCCFWNTQITFC